VLRDQLLEPGVLGGAPVTPGTELPLPSTTAVAAVAMVGLHIVHILGHGLLVLERGQNGWRRVRNSAEEASHPMGHLVGTCLEQGGEGKGQLLCWCCGKARLRLI
jgi:hypothetical protein